MSDEPLFEAERIGDVLRALLQLKTDSARRRVLAYAVDKMFGDPNLVAGLYAAAGNTDDSVCASHNLRDCRVCWPEVKT